MKQYIAILFITLVYSCERSYKEDPKKYCWKCTQEHIAPNEHWNTNMYYECNADVDEEFINHIMIVNTYSNADSTRQEILKCSRISN